MCRILAGQAGVHLQRTGETMAPSFFNSAKALSTSLRSAPSVLVTSPAETGLPAWRIACNTFSFIMSLISECNGLDKFRHLEEIGLGVLEVIHHAVLAVLAETEILQHGHLVNECFPNLGTVVLD